MNAARSALRTRLYSDQDAINARNDSCLPIVESFQKVRLQSVFSWSAFVVPGLILCQLVAAASIRHQCLDSVFVWFPMIDGFQRSSNDSDPPDCVGW